MTGLQEAFYIVGLVFMGLMLILIVALVIAVFVIRAKIIRIQQQIEDRINTVTHIAEKSGELAGIAAGRMARGAKRALNKAKR